MQSLLKAGVVATTLLAVSSLTSCNTVAGLGRDLENTGTALENAAN
ncbi:MAG: entericidin A/B family lipoprotein [Akkermansiaceae bacterium]|nr:entericidin A/B family lipoprotein [Akkermansiaceae bacterium]